MIARAWSAAKTLAKFQIFGVAMFAIGGIYVGLLIVGGNTTIMLAERFL